MTTESHRCAVCDGKLEPLFEKYGYVIAGCGVCGHRQVAQDLPADHTAAVYGDDYFTGGGAGYPDYLREAELLAAHGTRYARLIGKHCQSPGRGLDVGAAAGFITRAFQDAGWRMTGIEPNAAMAAHGREQLDLDIRRDDLESFACEELFDLIAMVQVVGHLRDIRAALANAARLTREGGLWLVETWNRASLPARLLGRHWYEYSPPSVLHWFTPEGFARLAGQFGMQQVAAGRPKKWIAGAHAKSLMRNKLSDSRATRWMTPALGVVPNRLSIPYPTWDLFWMVLRKE